MGLIVKPSVIVDGAIINGIAHFVRSTKPTARIDGSALVARDRWYNSLTGDTGFFNGTYWLGRTLDNVVNVPNQNSTGLRYAQTFIPCAGGSSVPFLLESVDYNWAVNVSNVINDSNYFTVATWLFRSNNAATTNIGVNFDIKSQTGNATLTPQTFYSGSPINSSGSDGNFRFALNLGTSGTVGSALLALSVNYKIRLVL
jgi:hypothetical protein